MINCTTTTTTTVTSLWEETSWSSMYLSWLVGCLVGWLWLWPIVWNLKHPKNKCFSIFKIHNTSLSGVWIHFDLSLRLLLSLLCFWCILFCTFSLCFFVLVVFVLHLWNKLQHSVKKNETKTKRKQNIRLVPSHGWWLWLWWCW